MKGSWTGSSMVEQLTLNQRVVGSSPTRFTSFLIQNLLQSRIAGVGRDWTQNLNGFLEYFAL